MATTEHTRNLPANHHLTRCAALQRTAAVGALALPTGAALASVPDNADPGLAQLEAGYARWRDIRAQMRAQEDRTEELADLVPEPEFRRAGAGCGG